MKESNKNINFKALKHGDYISRISYCKVINVLGGGVRIQNEFGKVWDVGGEILENEMVFSSDQYDTTEKVSMKRLVELLEDAGDAVFTCIFHRQPKEVDVKKAITSINKGKILSNNQIEEVITNAYKGRERTVIGYRIGTDGLGRTLAIDLKKDDLSKSRIISIDHRTIKELILKNVKYIKN